MPARLPRTLIRVSGPDARGFLNNVLTQNLDRLDDAGVLYGALLSPQGKLIADMLIWADAEGVILEADPTHGADLLRRLSMYKLRANATLEDISATHDALWSADAFDSSPPDPRLAALGYRAIAHHAEHEDATTAYNAHRIKAGVPDLARDAGPEEVFAGEALLDELHGVDFQKGCFVGQENVSRMKRRATTRKKFCPVTFDGPPPSHGTLILAGPAELGTIRTGVDGHAIALLRLDRALTATAPLTADGRAIELDPPPWLTLPADAESAS